MSMSSVIRGEGKNKNPSMDKMLQEKFDEIIARKMPEWEALAEKKSDDVCTYYLRGKLMEIRRLEKEITALDNPERHFTKRYRTLEGHCSKLQTDLDKLDVFGREDLKSLRKKAFVDLDEMIKALAKKAHSNGEICSNCEVQS